MAPAVPLAPPLLLGLVILHRASYMSLSADDLSRVMYSFRMSSRRVGT
jgi:hypothetical protein